MDRIVASITRAFSPATLKPRSDLICNHITSNFISLTKIRENMVYKLMQNEINSRTNNSVIKKIQGEIQLLDQIAFF